MNRDPIPDTGSKMLTPSVIGPVAAILVVAILALLGRGREVRLEGEIEGTGTVAEMGADTFPVVGVPAEVGVLLEQGRFWRAAEAMRAELSRVSTPSPEAIVVAARAEAGWGGWTAVVEYLEGRPWLDQVLGGEGWYWLARAYDEVGRNAEAEAAYDRFIRVAGGSAMEREVAVAELRRALVLLEMGRREAGAEGLDRVAARAPYLGAWADLLTAEALAVSGDTAAVRESISSLPAEAGMLHRGRVALVQAHRAAGDDREALRVALAYRAMNGLTATQRAHFALLAGQIALDLGDDAVALRELRSALTGAPSSVYARDAANLLNPRTDLTPADRLAIGDVYERHGNMPRAAAAFRAWMSQVPANTSGRDEVRLRLGRALFNAGEFTQAEEVLRPLHESSPAVARQAMLLTGRSQYRRGQNATAFRTLEQLANRFPGTEEGSEGLHLVADLNHDAGETETTAALYRRVADIFPGTDRAGLSLMRLAGMHYLDGNYAAAEAVWEEYRSRYPSGQRWLEATYWVARAAEQRGDSERARSLYQAVRARDPLSYYAVLASRRLGVDYWPIDLAPSPPVDSAAVARVAEWMRAVDMLRDAGLYADAEIEMQRLAERLGLDTATLYALAEALNERGHSIRGIRIGQQIQQSTPRMNERLLKILYPFPYRTLIEAEANERGLDPFVVAALVRQESLFTPRITSPAGARGLMQIMPETGATLARGIRLRDWDPELLFHPEINAHLGMRYLAEQMDRYDGSLPSVFSAYNAGPHRIDAWKDLPEFRADEELFTERIPYRETRDYVKILTRNIELYRGLYGG